MKAMIFAAGLGTRLKPLTDTMPKALVPVLGKPLVEHVIENLIHAGFDHIIINIHHFAEQVIAFIESKNKFGIQIEFSDERKKLLDTGGAIKKAHWFFNENEPILIHNADILSNVDLSNVYHHHIKNNALATLVVSNRNTDRYLLFDENNNLKGWINEKTNEMKPHNSNLNPSTYQKLAFSGIHVVSAKAIQYMKAFPEKFSIIDFYLSICNKTFVQSYTTNENSMIDVGKLDSLKKAEEFLRLRDM